MTSITLEDNGHKAKIRHSDGLSYPTYLFNLIPGGNMAEHIRGIRNMEIRDDDVWLTTFPRSGTHWMWEILTMLQKGSTEYDTHTKEYAMPDFRSLPDIAAIPSPRVLNSHHPLPLIPKAVIERKIKIVHVQRNPKDVFVSYFGLYRQLPNCGTIYNDFDTLLSFFLGKYGVYSTYPWFQYVKEWETFAEQNPDQIRCVYYEDLIEDPVREVTKLNEFLGCGRDQDMIRSIVDACTFSKLKEAEHEQKEWPFKDDGKELQMYRKGEVGDWMNWFSESQNRQMDEWLSQHLVDSKLQFRYTL